MDIGFATDWLLYFGLLLVSKAHQALTAKWGKLAHIRGFKLEHSRYFDNKLTSGHRKRMGNTIVLFNHTYCFSFPSRVSELLGYTAEELTGKNLYALCHGEDANKLRKCHVDCKY